MCGHQVSFSVREGAKVTIMGQNGAGKSSIIKLLSGEHFASQSHLDLNRTPYHSYGVKYID